MLRDQEVLLINCSLPHRCLHEPAVRYRGQGHIKLCSQRINEGQGHFQTKVSVSS